MRLNRILDRLYRPLPAVTITAYLTALAAVITLPLIAFVAVLLAQLQNFDREALRWETASDARVLARVVESRLQDMSATLRLLAVFPELEEGNLESLQNRMQSILSDDSVYLVLVDESGMPLLNTRVPYGTPPGPANSVPALQSALETGRIAVSAIFFDQTAGNRAFNVILPLPEDHQHSGAALMLTQEIGEIQSIVGLEALPPDWSMAVLDQNGMVIASNGPAGPDAGKPYGVQETVNFSRKGGAFEYSRDGRAMLNGYSKLTNAPWIVTLWGPIASAQAPIISTWKWLIWGSLVFIGISMLIGYTVARQLGQPIRSLARTAERLGKGEIVPPPLTKLTEANQIAVALSNASFDRSEAEDRIRLMLHELVHRSKNVLALVQAIHRQLARQSSTKEEFQQALEGRLQGLAQSIELLAQENWSGLSLKKLIEQHLSTVGVSADQIVLDGEDFMLRVSAVQNLGLALHELATNSIKYGALSTPSGKVTIRWGVEGVRNGEPAMCIVWQEQGGPEVAVPQRSGFGSVIIERHAAAAFNGAIDLDYRAEGLRWSLHAPCSALQKDGTDVLLDEMADSLASSAAE